MSSRPLHPDLWNVLHDGGIEMISGRVPGELRLTIGISYLCELFEDSGESVLVTLHDCSRFAFKPWDGEETLTDLTAILALDLEILSVDDNGGIVCAVSAVPGGVLTIEAAAFSLALGSNRPIELQDLLVAAKTYWTAFGNRNP
jgi:hypothetical protein